MAPINHSAQTAPLFLIKHPLKSRVLRQKRADVALVWELFQFSDDPPADQWGDSRITSRNLILSVTIRSVFIYDVVTRTNFKIVELELLQIYFSGNF